MAEVDILVDVRLARKFTWVGRVRMLEEPSAVPLQTHFLLRGGARPDALGISYGVAC
jgi:hypothetical protein